jgi:hypothetical protein
MAVAQSVQFACGLRATEFVLFAALFVISVLASNSGAYGPKTVAARADVFTHACNLKMIFMGGEIPVAAAVLL